MESLDGATTRKREPEQSKGWIDLINTVLQVLGGFFLINGIYFALFTTSIYTAMVYYSFVLMVLTGIGYCYYFTAEDIEDALHTWRAVGISVVDSLELPGAHSTPERRRRL
jgi:hypothetical protein